MYRSAFSADVGLVVTVVDKIQEIMRMLNALQQQKNSIKQEQKLLLSILLIIMSPNEVGGGETD